MRLSWKRTLAILKKEKEHILRDPFTLGLTLFLPLSVVLIFGFAIEFNLKEVPTAYVDLDKTTFSRQFLDLMGSSEYFKLNSVSSPEFGFRLIESEEARALIIINPELEKNIYTHRPAVVQLILDGADNSSVSSLLGYAVQIQKKVLEKNNIKPALNLKTRYLYNPELNSKWFIVPGLAVVVLSILAVLLTALTITREWENGSMELLLSTPAQPLEILIGKMTPYAFLGMGAVFLVYILARVCFQIPFHGSHGVFLLGCLLFLTCSLGQGLLVSVKAKNQQMAMQMAMMISLMPATLLSGFIYPIEHMPRVFQYLTLILPSRWFMEITRDQFLKSSEFLSLWKPFLALTLLSLFFLIISAFSLKKDLE